MVKMGDVHEYFPPLPLGDSFKFGAEVTTFFQTSFDFLLKTMTDFLNHLNNIDTLSAKNVLPPRHSQMRQSKIQISQFLPFT